MLKFLEQNNLADFNTKGVPREICDIGKTTTQGCKDKSIIVDM